MTLSLWALDRAGLGVFVAYMLLTGAEASFFEEMVSLMGVYLCINIATVAIVIGVKWR